MSKSQPIRWIERRTRIIALRRFAKYDPRVDNQSVPGCLCKTPASLAGFQVGCCIGALANSLSRQRGGDLTLEQRKVRRDAQSRAVGWPEWRSLAAHIPFELELGCILEILTRRVGDDSDLPSRLTHENERCRISRYIALAETEEAAD